MPHRELAATGALQADVTDRMPDGTQLGGEGVGQHPVAALGRVQPVDGPRLQFVRAGQCVEVDAPHTVPGHHDVDHAVVLVDAVLEHPPQPAGQLEHPALVVEPHGDDRDPGSGQLAADVVEVLVHPPHREVGPERVVDARDDDGRGGLVAQRLRQLGASDVGQPRAGDGVVAVAVVRVGGREDRAEATPAAGNEVADTDRCRVTE
jgi:hypothetical protein